MWRPIDHVSLTLDGVTSFFRVINIGNIYKHLRYSQTFGGFLQCNGWKLEEFEGYNCFYIVYRNKSALVRELLGKTINKYARRMRMRIRKISKSNDK